MLPIDYRIRMKDLLEDEYDDFIRSLEAPEYKALRLNLLKADRAQLLAFLSDLEKEAGDNLVIEREPVPWEECGFYYSLNKDASDDESKVRGPGSSPLHEAGAFYIQEPSAMKPVSLMDIKPGERVLDMCAAPGGKSTQIAADLGGEGMLISNEYVRQRALILSSNIERMAVKNAIVLNETPEKIGRTFPGFFDKVLVDAPCSGEGMFRKNEQAVSEWSLENVKMCAARQDEILDHAACTLRYGGILVYSTCTFSPEEDEECVKRFLDLHPEYELISMEKLYPHKIRGEGHFVAKLSRGPVKDQTDAESDKITNRDAGRRRKKDARDERLKEYLNFLKELIPDDLLRGDYEAAERLLFFGDNLYLVPGGAPKLDGLKVVRPGLQLGTFLKNRFEPAHAWAMTLKKEEVINSVDITYEEARAYLAGMTIPHEGLGGWCLVCYNGISLGWGKLTGNIIKNHYPKGLRKNWSLK
ncbi:MAG: RsmF rRNA methyltransferase first C-terminal domain-containing protein [Lachnospiraceae bacterium]|nr:RsmF rRNA methyltransferase first C-terminal domain-containing protein [Lachnospiraceae bacterium]